MGTRSACLLGALLSAAACTPTEFVRAQPDAGAARDVPVASDGPAVADVAAPTRCTADRECANGVCDLGAQRCVECLASSSCTGGAVCLGTRCVMATACTTSRTCPGQVCSATLGVCVDCDADTDCAAGEVCRRNVCAPAPRACMSSRECSDLGQVCDTARRICVECLGDNDCTAEQHCGAQNLCLADLCTAGATRCADLVSQMTCDARGVTETATRCPTGQSCRGTRCEATSCAPGQTRCASNGMLETCAMDGSGYTGAACGSQQSCSDGRCVTWMCTPGARVCLDAMRVNVCDPSGLTATPTPCATGETCQMGQCVTQSCTPGAASCANGTTRRVCNGDGRSSTDTPCPSGQRCEAGTCRAMACTPGTATCGTTQGTRNVCNAEGTGTTVMACPESANVAMATCSGGSCGVVCAAGYGDCDVNVANGCESDLNTDRSNCGACGRACGGTETCSGGTCRGRTVPNFNGVLGPDFSRDGLRQCVGVLDREGQDDMPLRGWANLCIGATYRRLRIVCGATNDSYRYIDLARNVFVEPLRTRPEAGLIINSNFPVTDNRVWVIGTGPLYNPNETTSNWLYGGGCTSGESAVGLQINTEPLESPGYRCRWDVNLCFGQGIEGDRIFSVYVGE